MAGTTLNLVLAGLMAYVSQSNGKEVTILLPKADGHEVRLYIPKDNLVSADESLKLELIFHDGRPFWTRILPAGHDLRLSESMDQGSANESLKFKTCETMRTADGLGRKKVCLPSMDSFLPKSTKVAGDCLIENPGPKCQELEFRLRLTQGKLCPLNFSESSMFGTTSSREVTWIQGGKSKSQWLPEAMLLKREFESPTVAIELTSWGGSQMDAAKKIVLKSVGQKVVTIGLVYSPTARDFCDCQGGMRGLKFGPAHLHQLSKLSEIGYQDPESPIELSSDTEKKILKNQCEGLCMSKPMGLTPIICYSAAMNP